MQTKLNTGNPNHEVDIKSLTPDELRAFIAGLRERRQSLISSAGECQCDQCRHQLSCAYRSQAA